MGLTYSEAERLGIQELHPDHPNAKPVDCPDLPTVKAAPTRVRVNARGQNKLEARFDSHLGWLLAHGRILGYRFEPLKLRLGGRCWYKIDFVARRRDGTLAGIELKGGYIWDDAKVKLAVAPVIFPLMDYYIVRADGPRWDVRPVTREGVGAPLTGDAWADGWSG